MLKFLIADRQIFGLSNRWHREINSSRNLACAHMASLQKPGSCQTDQLQDTALNIPSSTEILISANEECLFPDCVVLDVDWKKACVNIQAASSIPPAFFCIPENWFSINPGPVRNTIYLLVPDFKSIWLQKQTGEMRETRKTDQLLWSLVQIYLQ